MYIAREGDIRVPSGCAVCGIMNYRGERFDGTSIVDSIALMHERSNGLGGGFAAYGIYPDFPQHYALHLFYLDEAAKAETEELIRKEWLIELDEPVPTRKVTGVESPPVIWRYFVQYKHPSVESHDGENPAEAAMVDLVMKINAGIQGAFVASSGQNMGIFKGVGYPEDIGDFYRLDEYSGYTWIAHGRFPTNTPGWWGGAHPFGLLDLAVVHNGEISSYGANRRYLEMFGYKMTLQTDTEVVAYAVDLLWRRYGYPLELVAAVLAPPFWKKIDRMPHQDRELYTALRSVYGSLMMNGPFSIIVGWSKGMFALNDRIKLRSLVAAEKDDYLYVASEESAIRQVCPHLDRVWFPRGGELVVGRIEATAQESLSGLAVQGGDVA